MEIFGFIFSILLVGLSIVLLIRNQIVYRHRTNMLHKVSGQAKKDIWSGNPDWQWRYAEMSAVSYHEMVMKFWKKPDSFYDKNPAREIK